MIDIHCHVLPGVDDGATSLDEAVEMCRLAAADGCEVLIATPHQWHPSWENTDAAALAARLETLRAGVGPAPRLYLGAEIRVDSELLLRLDELEKSGFLALAGSRYLLLELDRSAPSIDPLTVIHEVSVAGYQPILAHPELLPWLADDLEMLADLVAHGALLQLTCMSITGGFGPRARQCAESLLGHDLAHFVASDSHGTATRRPGLREAYDRINKVYGMERARRLTSENPRAVLEDRPVAVAVT